MPGFSESYNINKYDAVIKNELFECRVFWAKIISSESENLLTSYQKHTFWEIEYALEGRIGFMTENNPHMFIEEGEFFIVPPDTFHQVVDGDSSGARFIMAFSIDGAGDTVRQRIDNMRNAPPLKAMPNMEQIVTLLVNKNYHDTPIRKKIISSMIECFILEVLEAVNPQRYIQQKSRPGGDSTAEAICRYIHEYNGIGIRVSDVAAKFGLSERHLNRILSAATGMTPKEAIDHEKLKKIEELVTSTGLSFGEISVLCGFSDEYSMNRFFQKNNNTTLSSFRKIKEKRADGKPAAQNI